MQNGLISAIHRDPKNKYRFLIYIEDEFAFDLHEDTFVKYQISKGKEIDSVLFAEIIVAEEQNKAYLLALRYLGIRPRTSFQLEKYLVEKGFTEELAKSTRDRCIRQGYIDDESFAKQWVVERMRLKPRGAFVLRMELQQKGIAKEFIERAVKDIQRDDEIEAARMLILSRIRRKTLPLQPNEEQKILSLLIRKGFSQSIVFQVRQELRNGRLLEEEDANE